MFISIIFVLTSACTRIGEDLDPATLGYEVEVTYDTLGGKINQREKRNTNYAENSLLFEPKGSSNLLIEPVKAGYTLAGWYTNVKESTDKNGEKIYEFDAQDRWDFKVDRVHENTTLYARWVNQAEANYIDSQTGEVLFSKNITPNSKFSPLSGAILDLINSGDRTFVGYFDKNLKTEIDFDRYEYTPLLPSDKVLYDKLAKEFPKNFLTYTESEAEKTKVTEAELEDGAEIDSDELVENTGTQEDTSYQFLHQYGYELEADEDTIAKIHARKNEIIEQYISKYIANNEHNTVYLKFEEGKKVSVKENADLAKGGKYAFSDLGEKGEYIIENDLNFGDSTFETVNNFSSTIDGQNHVLSNVHLKLTLARKDSLKGGMAALFQNLDNATIKNITFRDLVIEVSAPAKANMQIAAIAINAVDSTMQNVKIDGLTIISGDGDNGQSTYQISDFVLNPENTVLDGIEGQNIVLDVSNFAELLRTF